MEDEKSKLTAADLVIGFARTPPTYFDDLPEGNRYISDVWEYFRIIRHTESKLPVADWFKCNIPGCTSPFVPCVLAKGNAKLTRHLKDDHKKMKPYTLPVSELTNLLSAISGLGERYGKIDADVFQQLMPPLSTESWNGFLENVEHHLNQRNCGDDPMNRSQEREGHLLTVDGKESSALDHLKNKESKMGSTSTNLIQLAINLTTDSMARIDLRSKS